MKTAVSIPDRIFAAAERYARRRGIPRSQVYAEALSRLLADEESEDELTAALDQTCAQVDSHVDEFGKTAARRRLAATEW
jgi:hypothetical protein